MHVNTHQSIFLILRAGAQLGGGALGARSNTFYTMTKAMYYLNLPITQTCLRGPPLKISQLRPCLRDLCFNISWLLEVKTLVARMGENGTLARHVDAMQMI